MASSHHRKFTTQKYSTTDCYLCYVCPENCYLPPPTPPPPVQFSGDNPAKNHVPTLLILMLCVLGVAFLVLSYLTAARYRRRRSEAPPEPSRTSIAGENQGRAAVDHPIWYIRTVGLPQSAIDAMASFAYADGLVDGSDCAVCLADFRDGDAARLLPKCGHAFHVDCIDTWLRSHKSCPVCRAPVAPDRVPPPAGNPSRAESGPGSARSGGSSPAAAAEVRGVRRSVSMDLSCASNSSIYRAMKRSQSLQLHGR
ncbi:E3 ubiquitin-protein ligase RING1-like [Salvia splendens]|uniref:E3 ubiquitin-protein ligase RING1-like n=1 Tax=Salvia splendens TaxID=180675 RepID=UPI001C26D89E|nr:E3 ubiquitin-protein ligase RING1-like [Salvia splendens]